MRIQNEGLKSRYTHIFLLVTFPLFLKNYFFYFLFEIQYIFYEYILIIMSKNVPEAQEEIHE